MTKTATGSSSAGDGNAACSGEVGRRRRRRSGDLQVPLIGQTSAGSSVVPRGTGGAAGRALTVTEPAGEDGGG